MLHKPQNIGIHFGNLIYRLVSDLPYELYYGISTSKGTREFEDDERQIVRYEPTPYATLRAISEHLTQHAPGVSRFVDVGCGLGRPLHFFAPSFDELLGYELAEPLFRAAIAQLQRAQKKLPQLTKVSIHMADATAAIPIDSDMVVFLYNPFGPRPMMQLCERLRQSRRAIHIYYVNPKHADVIEECLGPVVERFTRFVEEVAYFHIPAK